MTKTTAGRCESMFFSISRNLLCAGSVAAGLGTLAMLATTLGAQSIPRIPFERYTLSNALSLALYLDSDRMGFLLQALDSAKVNLQRDVVKNKRCQRVDNVPYGKADETILAALYPAGHPYSWPVIGSMADLSAATLEDVKSVFRAYYAPNNATLVIAGDFNADRGSKFILPSAFRAQWRYRS